MARGNGRHRRPGGAAAGRFRTRPRLSVHPRWSRAGCAPASDPLDFPYRVHTAIGHNCRRVKVNWRIVPVTYVLHAGEQVEIITGRAGGPRRDWLNPNVGYVTTSRARAKVQHWFKQQAREQNVQAGKVMLERELARMALTGTDYAQLIERLGIRSQEDLFAALGSG